MTHQPYDPPFDGYVPAFRSAEEIRQRIAEQMRRHVRELTVAPCDCCTQAPTDSEPR